MAGNKNYSLYIGVNQQVLDDFLSSFLENDTAFAMTSELFSMQDIKVLTNETKKCLCTISNFAYMADKEKDFFISTFAPKKDNIFKPLCSYLANPDKEKLIKDFDSACSEISKKIQIKEIIEEERNKIREMGFSEWEDVKDYLAGSSEKRNKTQNLQLLTLVFNWYNKEVINMLQTVMKRAGDIKGDEDQSKELFDKQCKRLHPTVISKYEEVKNFPTAFEHYKENPITELISKGYKEEDIAKTHYHDFTEEDLINYLVYKCFQENQIKTPSGTDFNYSIIVKDNISLNNKVKFVLQHLPYILEIKRGKKITGIHLASIIKWIQDETKPRGKDKKYADVNIKELLIQVQNLHGKDYKVCKHASSITEGMHVLNGTSTTTSDEKRMEHIKDLNSYKSKINEHINHHYKEQVSA